MELCRRSPSMELVVEDQNWKFTTELIAGAPSRCKSLRSHLRERERERESDCKTLTLTAMDPNDEDHSGEITANAAVLSRDHVDVSTYASLYSGRTKLMRLLFIADQCDKNHTTKLEALRLAYEEAKKGEDTEIFREIVWRINGRLGAGYDDDVDWRKAVERRAEKRKGKLESELSGYRTSLIKESIRMGYNDLGDFLYAHGALGDAFKNYIRSGDYCNTPKHIIHMCLSAILVSIEMGQFIQISNYVNKAEKNEDALDPVTVAKLRAVAGLGLLQAKKYNQAARKFLDIGNELGSNYNEVIAPHDIATYGGLCALSSFDRSELKSKVINNVKFRSFLELVPEVREIINSFYSSHYASCLELLGKLKANLLLDIHLHDHVETLCNDIRHKALIQYTHPFVSVDLRMMAIAFETDVLRLEKELEALITSNKIQARIDSHDKILYAQIADQRNATFRKVLQTGGEFERDVRSMLLRARLIKHDHNARSRREF